MKIPGPGRRDPGLPGDAATGRAVPGRPGRPGDLRRPRAHQGHLPPASPSSATWPSRRSCTPARATCRRSSDIHEIISKVVSKVPDAQVMSDLDATVAWAKGTGKGDTAKLGITGFCWGGRIVWLYAAHNPNLKAGVAWYGRLVGEADELHPKNPIDLVGDLKAPVLGLYGGADQGIPVAVGREDASSPQGGRQDGRDRPLPRHAARLLRRLSAELPQGQGRGRLEADAGVVQEERRGISRQQAEEALADRLRLSWFLIVDITAIGHRSRIIPHVGTRRQSAAVPRLPRRRRIVCRSGGGRGRAGSPRFRG